MTDTQGSPAPSVEQWLEGAIPRLFGLAYALTGDKFSAEDLTQEALATVVRKWRRVSAAASPTAYARTVVVNTFLSQRRKRWTRELVSDDLAGAGLADHERGFAERVVDRDALLTAVAALPPRQRAAITLRFYEDLADADIAAIMGCSVSTVRSSVHHALKTMRASASAESFTEARS